jgi:hypothetical protein
LRKAVVVGRFSFEFEFPVGEEELISEIAEVLRKHSELLIIHRSSPSCAPVDCLRQSA